VNKIKIVLIDGTEFEYETSQDGMGLTPNGFLAIELGPNHHLFYNPTQVRSYEFRSSKIQKAAVLPNIRPVQ
jgi:hypothetical protein